ncbi:hypothetical protein, partial [Sabulibacter ruber]
VASTTAFTGISLWLSRQAAQKAAITLTSEIAEHQAVRVAAGITHALNSARSIADLIDAERSTQSPRREVVNRYLQRLASNPAFA